MTAFRLRFRTPVPAGQRFCGKGRRDPVSAQLTEIANGGVRSEARVRENESYERGNDECGRRHYRQDAPIAVISVGRSERLLIAQFQYRPAALPPKRCARRGRQSNRPANCRRRRQSVTPITPDERRLQGRLTFV